MDAEQVKALCQTVIEEAFQTHEIDEDGSSLADYIRFFEDSLERIANSLEAIVKRAT